MDKEASIYTLKLYWKTVNTELNINSGPNPNKTVHAPINKLSYSSSSVTPPLNSGGGGRKLFIKLSGNN